jgi:signal transduction histidine kinase
MVNRWAARVFVLVMAAARPSAAETVSVAPSALPLPLVSGWEASDEDPPQGVAGLETLRWRPADPLHEPGPRETIRWYRQRLDLSACRGLALAFYATSIRDADETYLDGQRIGATGSLPPDVGLATIQTRLYRLPTDLTNAAGLHVLAIRVYQGPSLTSVFRFPPQIDALATTQRRSWIDQVLAALAAVSLSLAAAFVLFYRTDRDDTVHLVLAALSALFAVYLLTGHSIWGALEVPPQLPHRIVMVTGPLLCLLYYSAMWSLLEARPPRRFRWYDALFAAYALMGALTPDLRVMVVPTRLVRALALVCLAEMIVPTFKAVSEGRPRARGVLAGHLVFGPAIVWLNLTLLRDPWFYSLPVVALVLLALTLYSLGSQQVEARMAAIAAERGRIAREIHDNLAQGLVAISLQLEAARDSLATDVPAAEGHLERAQGLAQSSLAEARRSVWDLRPTILVGRDVGSALAQIAHRLGSAAQAHVQLDVRGQPVPLPAALEKNLLEIGKEAMTNAARHAGATRVSIVLAFEEREVRLSVQDDGRGFDPARPLPRGRTHFGLMGMSERAIEVGGRLTIDSRPGGGTRVEGVFPLVGGLLSPPCKARSVREDVRAWLRGLLSALR